MAIPASVEIRSNMSQRSAQAMRLESRVAARNAAVLLKKTSAGADRGDQGNGEPMSASRTLQLAGPRGLVVGYYQFIRGFGSVSQLFPDRERYHFRYRFYRPEPSIKAALLRDWSVVGLDLCSALPSATIPTCPRESEDAEPAIATPV